jgi:signal transduction histidine kinase
MEGRNLIDLRDLKGNAVVKDEIAAAMKEGKAWLDCFWYRPGGNTQAMKRTYVRKVQAGKEVFIVGSGIYVE